MVLLRDAFGEEIRRLRQEQLRSLREVAAEAAVSLGYLSEIERGLKEPSSEVLASICRALDITLPDFLLGVVFEMAREDLESGLTSIMH